MVELMFSLGFFALEGNPFLCMRVLYLRLWNRCVLCEQEIERWDCERKQRILQWFAVGCASSFCWIIERKDWLFGVDVAQTGWTAYICVSLVLCIFCVYISAIFYVFHCYVIYNILTIYRASSYYYDPKHLDLTLCSLSSRLHSFLYVFFFFLQLRASLFLYNPMVHGPWVG